ncbi:hypothetical protein ACJ72_07892 [Emergomyces africanus]|uniref:Uncharacterized protein n=1 Tax=Emergomyces africanus TaxID=1955775 RepID=A0A1B7NLY5_9EURO|nr:hypothetical protein ACJ72_07892 [Emergomyces africanus]
MITTLIILSLALNVICDPLLIKRDLGTYTSNLRYILPDITAVLSDLQQGDLPAVPNSMVVLTETLFYVVDILSPEPPLTDHDDLHELEAPVLDLDFEFHDMTRLLVKEESGLKRLGLGGDIERELQRQISEWQELCEIMDAKLPDSFRDRIIQRLQRVSTDLIAALQSFSRTTSTTTAPPRTSSTAYTTSFTTGTTMPPADTTTHTTLAPTTSPTSKPTGGSPKQPTQQPTEPCSAPTPPPYCPEAEKGHPNYPRFPNQPAPPNGIFPHPPRHSPTLTQPSPPALARVPAMDNQQPPRLLLWIFQVLPLSTDMTLLVPSPVPSPPLLQLYSPSRLSAILI